MNRSKLRQRPRGKTKTESFVLKGGLNLVDAPLNIPDGMCLAATNYELLYTDGYRRADGFERYDGQPKPSEASYWILDFDAGDIVQPEVGGLCAGVTSGATGVVGAAVLESGTWAGADAAGYLSLFNVSGTFQDNEALTFTGADDAFNSAFSSGFN